jgi:hypothetical protein
VDIAGNTEGIRASGSGSALAGFLVSGFLLALLGAILPAWGYHRDPPDFIGAGNYFLSLAIGIVAAARYARPIMLRRGLSFLLVFAWLTCSISITSLVSPPLSLVARRRFWSWRSFAQSGAVSRHLARIPGGCRLHGQRRILVGLGCRRQRCWSLNFTSTVPSILIFMALSPASLPGFMPENPTPTAPKGASHTTGHFRFSSPGAVLFALLIFFQFGNELSLPAG